MSDQTTRLSLLASLIASTLRVSLPLVFAALGGLASERSGVINIALEGMMLVGALGAAIATLLSHSPWIGLGASIACGVSLAALYGLCVIRLKSNQIVAGTAINMLAVGICPFVCKLFYGSTGNTPSIPIEDRFQIAPFILAPVVLLIFYAWLKYSASGLWLRFAGEHPEALDAAGVGVNRVRWVGVLVSGVLAGMGGAVLSTFLSSSFSRNMTAGRGFMALAALIFGKWRPLQTAIACLLFGFADALQIRLQGVVVFGTEPIPVQFIQILPYFFTILVLAGWVGQSRPPRALGMVFGKN